MALTILAIAFVALAAELSQAANPYCTINAANTLCKYTNATWGTACVSAIPSVSTVSAADIAIILDVHNSYRRKVAQGLETRGPQPKASNMRQLVWDSELAVMAQTHAQQCVFQHDTNRDVSRFQVGQNIYIAMSSASITKSNWNATIQSWYEEVVSMQSSYVSSFPSSPPSVIGHYTQVVWATTSTVGCGVVSYQTPANTKYPNNRLYVCNYGPAGNWLGSPIYQQGNPGSACPTGTTNSNGLCA